MVGEAADEDARAALSSAAVAHDTWDRRGGAERERPGRRSWLPVASAGWSDSAVLMRLVPDIAGHDVYICGNDTWMATVKDAVFEAGTPESNIHTERFDW